MNRKSSRRFLKRSSVAVMLLSSLVMAGCTEKSMEEHLEDARAYAQSQQVDAAIVEYKNAIQLQPDAALPRFELGKMYLQNNNFTAAEKELNRALELGHPANEVIPLLSMSYQQSGAETALAGVDYRAQGMTAVESAEVGFYKLQALVQLEKSDEARALLNDLMTLDTSTVYKGLIDSYQYILNDNYAAALSATEALREQAPQNKDLLLQLARLYLLQNQQEKAIEVYDNYVSAYPDDVQSKFAFVALLVEQKELDKAEPIVDELLKINENHPLLNTFKGIIESANGNYQNALERLEIAIMNGKSDQVVRLVAGFSAYQIQDFEAAQRHLSMVASSLPANHPGLRMLADSMLQLGESDGALDVLNRVSSQSDTDAALFSKASYQLLKEGNVAGAREMVEKSEAVSNSPEDLARLGVLQLSLNDVDGLVNIEEAVKQAPESPSTQNTLIRAYLATGQLEKAKEAANEWREQSPQFALPVVYLANIATAEKDYDAAEGYLAKAVALEGSQDEVVFARTKLHIVKEEQDKALAVIKQFLNDNPESIQAITYWYAIEASNDNSEVVIKHATKQLDKDQDNIMLRLLLARMHSLNGDLEETVSLLSSIEGDRSTPMAFWRLKGQALVATNKVEQAKALFERWLELYPRDKNAVLGTLLILDAENNFKEGLALTEKFLDKRTDPQISLLKAYFLSKMGRTAPAWEIINNASDEAKELPFVRGIIARLYVFDKKPEKALDHAMAAYETVQNDDNALLVLAILDMTDKKDEAYAFISEHVEKYPNDIRSAMLLAERQIVKDQAKASQTYETILQKTPENFVVLNNLAYLKLQEGDLNRAETLAKRALAIQPDQADAVDTLAQVHVAQGDKEEALSLYESIATETIRSEEVYLNYVELLLQFDKDTLARRLLSSREFKQAASQSRLEGFKQSYGI
ncbi:PEP-CTERM system TPR-repeat protein PrsT [Alteromonas sp. 345S023]|uniref:PEP-CTERM system TPR-repeat protein PrsT n=1 Tax=Alteromonas profundi TaxID=2696062 RepID=A0A7X5LMR0_9ALTE|nr:XrtA/PEP-CTERM system TPR-repeat protein PrsT [Alteromonas profundi]NDV91495.1 PEP-CTERM system TPR-repeat protein PrsT [Alteromonas profundi]